MSITSLASVLLLYPLTLFGDGCVLIAIALAATVGGRPLVWGSAFAAFHALYGIIGMMLASEMTTYSERLGDVFVLLGAVILLRHFIHHRLHHYAGGDCSCEKHTAPPMSTRAIISTASALSLHSLASGAIVRSMTGEVSTLVLIGLLVGLSLVIGGIISGIVLIGEKERLPILRALDALPGIVTAILTGVCCFSVYHLISDLQELSQFAHILFVTLSALLTVSMGLRVHKKSASLYPTLITTISRRQPSNR